MKKLYHLVHGAFKGEALNPTQANDRDPEPYVYATDQMCECLPYATPNGTRICNVTLPERNMTITLIPDRDAFLKNGKIQGAIYELPQDTFTKSPHHDTQFISKEPVPLSKMHKIAEIGSIEDAMHLGLQVLFTNDSFTSENYDFYKDIMDDPEFPDNLRHYVDQGIFTYENERRGIKADPYLSSSVKPAPDPQPAPPAPKMPPPAMPKP